MPEASPWGSPRWRARRMKAQPSPAILHSLGSFWRVSITRMALCATRLVGTIMRRSRSILRVCNGCLVDLVVDRGLVATLRGSCRGAPRMPMLNPS
jgi:hypothetical protein